MAVDLLNQELAEIWTRIILGHHLFYEFHSVIRIPRPKFGFVPFPLGHWPPLPLAYMIVLWKTPAFIMAAPHSIISVQIPFRFWHDQLFCKPAQAWRGSSLPSDYFFIATKNHSHVHTLLAGPRLGWLPAQKMVVYHYIPKSHKMGPFGCHRHLLGTLNGLMPYLNEDQKKEFKPTPIDLKKGMQNLSSPLLWYWLLRKANQERSRSFSSMYLPMVR